MSKFFEKYTETYGEKESGIPGLEMNAPIVNNSLKGDIGIEFELEGARLLTDGHFDGIKGKETGAFWASKADGSLRNGGREYVLSQPCKVEELPDLLLPFFRKFESKDGTQIQNSNRCSTHVHINAKGFKINELTSLLGLWMALETPLIMWNGEERFKNHFCLSSNDEEGVAEAWCAYLRTGCSPIDGAGRGLKYSALNILTLWTFGSVEFRCGQAADEPNIPLTWASFLYAFVQYAKKTYPNPAQIAYDLSERGAKEIFRSICDEMEDTPIDFFTEVTALFEDNFDIVCLEGFRNAQPFVMGFPWDEWSDLVNREYVPNPFAKKSKKKSLLRSEVRAAPATRFRIYQLDRDDR